MTRITISIGRETHERLKSLGRKSDTFDAIIQRLLDKEGEVLQP